MAPGKAPLRGGRVSEPKRSASARILLLVWVLLLGLGHVHDVRIGEAPAEDQRANNGCKCLFDHIHGRPLPIRPVSGPAAISRAPGYTLTAGARDRQFAGAAIGRALRPIAGRGTRKIVVFSRRGYVATTA
jgi:hypothetical protein